MEYVSNDQQIVQMPKIERIASLVLWPGEKASDLLKIEDAESRMLFRLFINLSVYAKVAAIIALLTV